MSESVPRIRMEQVTDPVELAKFGARQAQLDRNWAWFEQHAQEIYRAHRGKCLCIAGAELFVGDTPEEAVAKATEAHPDDEGRFTRYIPKERLPRIYAVRRDLAFV
jgi:hypothetical protein